MAKFLIHNSLVVSMRATEYEPSQVDIPLWHQDVDSEFVYDDELDIPEQEAETIAKLAGTRSHFTCAAGMPCVSTVIILFELPPSPPRQQR